MDTARVDICYRPLRIAWAIHSGDREAFRRAVRLTHTLWGGRFNPIVFADRPDEARQIIDLYRADMIVPIGDSVEVTNLLALFPYLINPFFGDGLFARDMQDGRRAQLLDIHNALAHWRDTPEWRGLEEQGLRRFVCAEDDPLADTLLVQTGAYPARDEIGIDYGEILAQAAMCIDCRVERALPLPFDLLEHPSLGFLTRFGLSRHYSVRAGWDYPGYYVGNAGDLDDLVVFWNLRAADISLQFFDPAHADRYAVVRPENERRILASVAHLDEHRRRIAVWSRIEPIENGLIHFPGQPLTACRVDSEFFWRGGGIRPPMMILGEASSLGVFSRDSGKPRVSFALGNKPFSEDRWFYTQHLIASVEVLGSDEQYTFHPPYVPEWNEFVSREMHFQHDKVRIEPDRTGIVINAADHNAFLNGLPASTLVEKLFESAGQRARLSGGGLIARQVISRLGGLTGARVFKIPGVRRLLKTYGPRDPFTKISALQLIGGRDPQNPQANFGDHRQLYIEARPFGTDLTAEMVFEYLVEKGLFRIGAELTCPTCNLANWIALDELKQRNVCELCGNGFDAARQLVRGVFHYRRTGVFGLEKNTQGAVPVVLTLQQLEVNLGGTRDDNIYGASYDLVPIAGADPPCEVDMVMIVPRVYPDKAEVILGECKDQGGIIDATDIANLRRIADALPRNRFETYILLVKLGPFTPEEIALAQALNGPYQRRVIMLTARELEPYHLYERTEQELGIQSHGGSLAELAAVTSRIYFQVASSSAAAPPPAATNEHSEASL